MDIGTREQLGIIGDISADEIDSSEAQAHFDAFTNNGRCSERLGVLFGARDVNKRRSFVWPIVRI